MDGTKELCKTVHDVCQVTCEKEAKSIFPGIYKAFKLLFTAPVSAAKDERSFSKIKIIKNLFSLAKSSHTPRKVYAQIMPLPGRRYFSMNKVSLVYTCTVTPVQFYLVYISYIWLH